MDTKINSMNPGDSIKISECGGIKVVAERSGCGSVVRFVRITANTSTVFLTSRWVEGL